MAVQSRESGLFRAEVLQAQSVQWLGSIRIGHNPRFTFVTAVAVLLAGSLIAFAVWGEVTRKARIPGILMPTLGAHQINASAPGVLLERRVAEGDFVHAGQVLFVVYTDHVTSEGQAAVLVAQAISQRRQTLESERASRELQMRQRNQALADRLRGLQNERQQAVHEAEFAERRVALAHKSQERYDELAKNGFVADIQAQQKQEELLDLQSRAQTARRGIAAMLRDEQSTQAEVLSNQTQLQTELAQLSRSLASLEQERSENESRKTLVLTAPQAGVITALNLTPGAAVQMGQTLATLVPGTQEPDAQGSFLEAQLFAPSRTAGFVQKGQSVWLRYAAFPYQKFGMAEGQVTSVSTTPVSTQDLPQGQQQALSQASQSSEPLYRVTVKLTRQDIETYGQVKALKSGMALEADVVQDKRAIWEWVLEPVLAARAQTKVLSASPAATSPGG